jgi:hypothetical protein
MVVESYFFDFIHLDAREHSLLFEIDVHRTQGDQLVIRTIQGQIDVFVAVFLEGDGHALCVFVQDNPADGGECFIVSGNLNIDGVDHMLKNVLAKVLEDGLGVPVIGVDIAGHRSQE